LLGFFIIGFEVNEMTGEQDNLYYTQFYSNAFPVNVFPGEGQVLGYKTNDFEKVMDNLLFLTDQTYSIKNFKKPMNLLVGQTSDSIIIGLNFDKAVVGNTSIMTLNKSQSNEKIEPFMEQAFLNEAALHIDTFIHIPFEVFNSIFNPVLRIFNDYSDLNTRIVQLIWVKTINQNLSKCIELIFKGINNNFYYGGTSMLVHPIFKAKDLTVDRNMCFCVLPFNKDRLEIFDEIIKPTLEKEFGINVIRSGNIFEPNLNIMESIWTYINQAGFIIADLSDRNPNVFYELGICHTLGKPVITLLDEESYKDDYEGKLPFDISSLNTIFYKNSGAGPQKLVEEIKKNVKALRTGKAYIE
jgi:hypothetical protein